VRLRQGARDHHVQSCRREDAPQAAREDIVVINDEYDGAVAVTDRHDDIILRACAYDGIRNG